MPVRRLVGAGLVAAVRPVAPDALEGQQQSNEQHERSQEAHAG